MAIDGVGHWDACGNGNTCGEFFGTNGNDPTGAVEPERDGKISHQHQQHHNERDEAFTKSDSRSGANGWDGFVRAPHLAAGKRSVVSTVGSKIPSKISGGPSLCKVDALTTCYKPPLSKTLNITRTAPMAIISVTGSPLTLTANGAVGTLTLKNTDKVLIAKSIKPDFTGTLLAGKVSVSSNTCASLSPGNSCAIKLKPGSAVTALLAFRIKGSNTNVLSPKLKINAPLRYALGGTVAGLGIPSLSISGAVVLKNHSNGNTITLTRNEPFNFSTTIPQGSAYDVRVLTQPQGQTCTLSRGAGVMGGAAVTNLSVNCQARTFTLSGNINNLNNFPLTLRFNNELLDIVPGTTFFEKQVVAGAAYDLSIATQPREDSCVLSGFGTLMPAANVVGAITS